MTALAKSSLNVAALVKSLFNQRIWFSFHRRFNMNNTALEKITEQITVALIVSLLPFIWYFIYLLRGGYATTPIYSVLIVSGMLFLDLAMLLFSYSKIYKNFSTGFLSTYSNPTDFNLIETLNQYEKALSKVSETLNDLDKKSSRS